MTPRSVLAARGPLAKWVDGYVARPQQLEMAEAIAATIEAGESLICEAGTGTGKTLAYLVPALLSRRKVIISTGTRNLQDQLFERDLPRVAKALKLSATAALLKGRANYLCLLRMHLAEQQGAELDRSALGLLAGIRAWGSRTVDGDLAGFPELPEESSLRGLVTSTAENCLGQACAHFDECFVFKARKRAQEADVAVVNHHLFLSDLGLRGRGHGELLPDFDVAIFDEAHQLPELASQFFTRSVTSHQWFDCLHDARAAYLKEAADLPEFLQRLDAVDTALRGLRLALGTGEGSRGWRELRDAAPIKAALDTLLSTAEAVREVLENFAARGRLLDNCFRRLTELVSLIAAFQDRPDGTSVQWLELRGRGFLLHQTPLDVAEPFRQGLDPEVHPCIFTSATLSVSGDFSHFAGRLGLQQVPARSWPSPFEFRHQSLLYIPAGLPDPRAEGYTERVIDAVLPLLALTGGRAFLLFTSYRALWLAAPLVRASSAFPVLVQGDAPRTELLERFRGAGNAVLLGTGSFWEGVDVRGQSLSCVIIDKLPFATPDDPVLQARLQKLEEEGRNPFMEYQLPEAVIGLRQGIGRLIRDEQDYGVLMICDPRLLSRPYGKVFLRSLPEMELVRDLQRVREFLIGHKHGK
ncbi:MAG: ATP-dependent DNA helicase [Gammaproteobacteria bacterium]|nr:ATP-dependent DNA helicase [Gammaproteobacteria bacterium]